MFHEEADSDGFCLRCPNAAGATVVDAAETVSAANQADFVQLVCQVATGIVSIKRQIRQ